MDKMNKHDFSHIYHQLFANADLVGVEQDYLVFNEVILKNNVGYRPKTAEEDAADPDSTIEITAEFPAGTKFDYATIDISSSYVSFYNSGEVAHLYQLQLSIGAKIK